MSIRTHRRRRSPGRAGLIVLICGLSAASGVRPAAQSPPVTGTIALEGTMQKFYRAANVIVVKTLDGVEHAFTFTRDLIVHGGRSQGPSALAGLHEGSTVVVHYVETGAQRAAQEIDPVSDEGVQITEGTVVRVSRARKEIVIRFPNGAAQTFQLTARAASDVGMDIDDSGTDLRVKVFFVEEGGKKVVHYFRRADGERARR